METPNKKKNMKKRVKAAVAAAVIAGTAAFGISNFRDSKTIAPKIEPINEEVKSDLWQLFYVKNSYRRNDSEFYSVQNTSSGPILLATKNGNLSAYNLGNGTYAGKQAVITADNKRVYVVFDGDASLFIINLSDGTVSNTVLPIIVKNPAIGVHNEYLYLLSESSNNLYVISSSGYIDEIDITRIVRREGVDTIVNPSIASSEMGAFFIASGFKHAHAIVWNGNLGNSQYFWMDVSKVFNHIGTLEVPHIAIKNGEMCITPSQNKPIACLRLKDGQITRVLK
ncbi:MAG: hypothetical protein ACP5H8_00020 [Candidatus Micrarchaeia archaeon]